MKARAKAGRLSGLLTLAACVSAAGVQADVGRTLLNLGSESLNRQAVQARLDALQPWQLEPFGATPSEAAEGFVRNVLALELMQVAEARRRNLEREPSTRDRQQVILARALETRLRTDLVARGRVTEADIQSYFKSHASEFNVPARISAWRIVVSSQQRALEIIRECQGAAGMQRWRQLARSESIDRATHMRGGDLGFVREDGSTDYPQLRVSDKIYQALATVEDGAILPAPLKLEDNYAVLWRRGSTAKRTAELAGEREKIGELLVRSALFTEREALLATLKQRHVKTNKPLLLEALDGKTFDPAPTLKANRLSRPPASDAGVLLPQPTDTGLR